MLNRRNVVAGIGGYGWASLIQLAATPVLIRLLGAEWCGLLGFYIAVQGLSKLFDFGISPTISRELARDSANQPILGRSILFATEYPYWGIGIALGILLGVIGQGLAVYWSATSSIPSDQIQLTFIVMGILLAVQWPLTLYEAALTGLRRIALLHSLSVVLRSLGVVGGISLLLMGPPELWRYLCVLIGAAIVHVAILAIVVRHALPQPRDRSRIALADTRPYWRFAAGMGAISLLSSFLIHADKVLLSGVLPLETLGQYVLASMIASGLYVLAMPVFGAVFPDLTGKVASGDRSGESSVYHLASQGLAMLIVPAAAVLVLFAYELLAAWTSDSRMAGQIAPVMQLLVIGTALNTFMTVPYALQLAHGRTDIAIRLHVVLVILFLPLLLIGSWLSGAIGAAAAWFILNLVYVMSGVPLTHQHLLRGEVKSWVINDVSGPALLGLAAAIAGWAILRELPLSPMQMAGGAFITLCCSWLVASMGSPRLRQRLLARRQATP